VRGITAAQHGDLVPRGSGLHLAAVYPAGDITIALCER
jgi:hypothetical protein